MPEYVGERSAPFDRASGSLTLTRVTTYSRKRAQAIESNGSNRLESAFTARPRLVFGHRDVTSRY